MALPTPIPLLSTYKTSRTGYISTHFSHGFEVFDSFTLRESTKALMRDFIAAHANPLRIPPEPTMATQTVEMGHFNVKFVKYSFAVRLDFEDDAFVVKLMVTEKFNPHQVFQLRGQIKISNGLVYQPVDNAGLHTNQSEPGSTITFTPDRLFVLQLIDQTWFAANPRCLIGLFADEITKRFFEGLRQQIEADKNSSSSSLSSANSNGKKQGGHVPKSFRILPP